MSKLRIVLHWHNLASPWPLQFQMDPLLSLRHAMYCRDVEEKPQLIPESRLELEHPLLSEEIPELSEEVPELRIPLADALPAQENLNTQGENVKTLPASQPEKIVQKKGHGTAMPMKVQSHPEGHREVAISMKDGKPSHIQVVSCGPCLWGSWQVVSLIDPSNAGILSLLQNIYELWGSFMHPSEGLVDLWEATRCRTSTWSKMIP